MLVAYSLISVLIISLISLAGVLTLAFRRELLNKGIFFLIALALGALLGDVFIHIIPETYAKIANPTLISLLIIGGILLFFIIEKFLHWHHHTLEHAEKHEHKTGNMLLIGDGVHNFIDGLLVASSYLISVEVGVATTIAVILHEIPQEIGNFGVLIHSGYSVKKALVYNFLSALTAFLGAFLALTFSTAGTNFALWLLPITAGGFIYIALSDLVPELHKDERLSQSLIQILGILSGVALMALLLVIE